MRPNLLDALRHTLDTGEWPDGSTPSTVRTGTGGPMPAAPINGPTAAGSGAAPVRTMLEASLRDRAAWSEPSTAQRASEARRRSLRQVGGYAPAGGGKKSTLAELGLVEATPASAPAPTRMVTVTEPAPLTRAVVGSALLRGSAAPTPCRVCQGSGVIPTGSVERTCGACGGDGYALPNARVNEVAPGVVEVEPGLPLEAEVVAPSLLGILGIIDTVISTADTVPWMGQSRAAVVVDGGPVAAPVGGASQGLTQPDSLPACIQDVLASPAPQVRPTCDLPTVYQDLPLFCVVTGPGGTGKTFWAKQLLANAVAAGEPYGCVLAATTGIAAVNLGEGTTINALLKFFNTQSLVEAFTGGWLEAQIKRHRTAGLRRILLDEMSMLDAQQLTVICRAIDNINDQKGPEDSDVGLILSGDFGQLAPVKAPFAFESPEWERFAKNTFRLTTIRRQSDAAFVRALMAVREGNAEEALKFFEPLLHPTTDPNFEGPTLLAKNEAVDKYNQLRLDTLAGPDQFFESSRWGTLRGEWGGDPKPKSDWGIPERLKLRVGAKVMILANHNVAEPGDWPIYEYVNGNIGTLTKLDLVTRSDARGRALTPEMGAYVRLEDGREVVVMAITRDNVIPLEPGRRKQLTAEGLAARIKDKSEIIGQITYMPLRLAYATSVHKAQGLTLDLLQVNIRDPFFSTGGMLYVALSRCRTAEGLRLVGTAQGFRARCVVNPKVKPFL